MFVKKARHEFVKVLDTTCGNIGFRFCNQSFDAWRIRIMTFQRKPLRILCVSAALREAFFFGRVCLC